jgi:hypothetical protein
MLLHVHCIFKWLSLLSLLFVNYKKNKYFQVLHRFILQAGLSFICSLFLSILLNVVDMMEELDLLWFLNNNHSHWAKCLFMVQHILINIWNLQDMFSFDIDFIYCCQSC